MAANPLHAAVAGAVTGHPVLQAYAAGVTGAGGVTQAYPVADKQRPRADQTRFRSFVERYVIARASFFRQDPDGHAADMWECILNAKRCYKLIERTGRFDDEDLEDL